MVTCLLVLKNNDKASGVKAIPIRPITGLLEGELEVAENHIKSLFKYIQPTPTCHFISDQIDGKWYFIVVVEPSNRLTEVTDKGAHKTKLSKGGRYIRVNRDTVLPNTRQEYELLRKFAGYSFCDDFHATATLDDLNYEYMKEYLVKTNTAQDLRKLPKEEMAKMLKLIGEEESNKDKIKNFVCFSSSKRE